MPSGRLAWTPSQARWTPGGAILPAVAGTLNRLEQAYNDVVGSSGDDFFRRLVEYMGLLESDKRIHKAAEAIVKELTDAEQDFSYKDDAAVAQLVELRNELVEKAPDLDDSDEQRPPNDDPLDRVAYAKFDKWVWTLANFDAVAVDGPEKVIERGELDSSPSRMLAEILRAKLFDATSGEPPARPDLADLNRRINAIARQEGADFQRVERVAQDSGFFALKHLEEVVSYLGVREPAPMESPEDKRELLESALKETWGNFHHLREAMRPKQARGSLDAKAKEAMERHEAECRTELDRLHRALKMELAT